MLPKGKYTIKGLLIVSKSLVSQKEDLEEPKENDVTKAVLEKGGKEVVCYFLDDLNFGINSIIEIVNVKNFPLFYKEDYKVIQKTKYSANKTLISKLLINK